MPLIAMPTSKDNGRYDELFRLATAWFQGSDMEARVTSVAKLESTVFRVAANGRRGRVSIVAKHMGICQAHLERLVLEKWLPKEKLDGLAPPLLKVMAAADGGDIWHLYGDLGSCSLSTLGSSASLVEAAVQALAAFHAAFAEKPVLAECRLYGRDLGVSFMAASIRDAIRSLNALPRPARRGRAALCERLHRRLAHLACELDVRSQVVAEHGGPETFLHGDPTLENVFVLSCADGLEVKLIDWDHAGVGPATFDLCTFAAELPIDERLAVWRYYFEAVKQWGWPSPPCGEMTFLFETFELARLAHRLIWPALSISEGVHIDWAFDELARVESWFESLKPLSDL